MVCKKFAGAQARRTLRTRLHILDPPLGILLLNDKSGAEVNTIVAKYHGDAEEINLEILRLWIGGKGKPVNWDTLIGVLKKIGLGTLAGDIQDGLHY